ncbi:uncharacterized protein Triagg1_8025 [Trichoderma aggressivum f. europaeum]|uniref:Uncharacterized protein n=1 Tax=Trichoderma aggressivum f. europaeum TaxID=173218 RepID=A0AAE1J1I2_9HYPO|nr:hypothetical protein Triagg1_8025 [Trichoderma aggressivum f. europaeum]
MDSVGIENVGGVNCNGVIGIDSAVLGPLWTDMVETLPVEFSLAQDEYSYSVPKRQENTHHVRILGGEDPGTPLIATAHSSILAGERSGEPLKPGKVLGTKTWGFPRLWRCPLHELYYGGCLPGAAVGLHY